MKNIYVLALKSTKDRPALWIKHTDAVMFADFMEKNPMTLTPQKNLEKLFKAIAFDIWGRRSRK